MSDQKMSDRIPSVTSLPASGDGPMPSNSPGGIQLDLFGPAVVHVSPSAPPGSEGENPTSDTSGLSSSVSSRSANLQLSLENRLRQDLDVNGSPEYELTWKQWGMESGLPICALRASAVRISDSDSTGWPSPMALDRPRTAETMAKSAAFRKRNANQNTVPLYLGEVAQLTGWPTPNTRDTRRGCNQKQLATEVDKWLSPMVGWPTPNAGNFNDGEDLESWESRQQRNIEKFKNGNGQGTPLSIAAQQAGWPSPMAGTPANDRYNEAGNTDFSRKVVELMTGWPTPTGQDNPQVAGQYATNGTTLGGAAQQAGWPTPRVSDTNGPGEHGDGGKDLRTTAGWATPTGRDHKDSSSDGTVPENGLLGRQVWGWNSPRATDGSNGGPNQSGGALSNDAAGSATPPGQTQSGSPSETGSKGVLNPALPLWLQGFPSDWLMVAPVKMSRVSS